MGKHKEAVDALEKTYELMVDIHHVPKMQLKSATESMTSVKSPLQQPSLTLPSSTSAAGSMTSTTDNSLKPSTVRSVQSSQSVVSTQNVASTAASSASLAVTPQQESTAASTTKSSLADLRVTPLSATEGHSTGGGVDRITIIRSTTASSTESAGNKALTPPQDYRPFILSQLQLGISRGKAKMADYQQWIAQEDTRSLLKWKSCRV